MKKMLLLCSIFFMHNTMHTLQAPSSRHLLDAIILRFYHIQRLSKSVKLLVWMSRKKLLPIYIKYRISDDKNKKIVVVQDDYVTFYHPRIIWCLEHIKQHHSLDPFLEIWDDLIHYQLVADQDIMREFICLVFYLYKDVVHQEVFIKNNLNNSSLEILFKKITDLQKADLEDILDVLDLLIDELPDFIEKYEINSHLTWKEWAKKHWLVATVAFSALCIKVMLHYSQKKTNADLKT